MRLQATLVFALIVLTTAVAQAASPLPDTTPWVRWIPYRYDTRPQNVALLNDMPCSLLSHPNGWGGLYITNASSGGHEFFVDLPDCSAPAGSGWTIPIFFRSRERLPSIQVAVGGLISMPLIAAARIAVPAAHARVLDGKAARSDTYRPPGLLARWRERSGSRFDAAPAMPRMGGTRSMQPSGVPQLDRPNPFSGPAPGAPAAQPMAMTRACCVAAEPRAQPMRSHRIRR
jgi:hypothetical protein